MHLSEAQSIADMPIDEARAEDGTIKFHTPLHDGHQVESVILPMTSKSGRLRHTLCVSSQVGCAMGCTFCETAQMGLMRSLTADEILLQWSVAHHRFGTTIDNIVFMGMGEPLDNVDTVIDSIRRLTDHTGPSIAPSRISVSTVGRLDGLARLSELVSEPGFHRVRLAVSVNAPNDAIRSSIMPLNRAMPMAALHAALVQWIERHRFPILLEYVLIPGVNDEPAHAKELAGWIDGLPCRVNVIPYNPRRDSPWPAPDEQTVDDFATTLRANGLAVSRRITLGRSLMAACGQLGTELIRKRRHVRIGTASG
jgi:23S rRNA (adenine2503-C2)-methyltransferase